MYARIFSHKQYMYFLFNILSGAQKTASIKTTQWKCTKLYILLYTWKHRCRQQRIETSLEVIFGIQEAHSIHMAIKFTTEYLNRRFFV